MSARARQDGTHEKGPKDGTQNSGRTHLVQDALLAPKLSRHPPGRVEGPGAKPVVSEY
jgi:hypothetical protein